MPVLVWSMTDDEAVVNMVDANLQRETTLPRKSLWHTNEVGSDESSGARSDFTSAQLKVEVVGTVNPES